MLMIIFDECCNHEYNQIVAHVKPKQAFTIVELLIVIVVIAILASLAVVAYNGIANRAHVSVLKNDLSSAAKQLEVYRLDENNSDQYPSDGDAANLTKSSGTTYQYTYTSGTNSYCLTGSNNGNDFYITSSSSTPTSGVCPGDVASGSGPPAGYEVASVTGGGSTSFDGYSAIQPDSCPSTGGSWIKVPGNTNYGLANGFCVQQYAAVNVGGVPTSQNTGNKWTVILQTTANTTASTLGSGAHLLTENEWMTIATNAAAQNTNWSGGAVGSGTLPTGSGTATHGGVALTLSNGAIMYFDTGASSYYASQEWTCYTGSNASNCGIAAQYMPAPAAAYHTDQFGLFTNYGSLSVNGSGHYYGDPRYSNPSLNTYISSARNKGLGYLRDVYAAGSSTVYGFSRGYWNGATSSGLFTLYLYTDQSYSHATYGFRAAAP